MISKEYMHLNENINKDELIPFSFNTILDWDLLCLCSEWYVYECWRFKNNKNEKIDETQKRYTTIERCDLWNMFIYRWKNNLWII